MIYLYLGTDREKVRSMMRKKIEQIATKDNATIVRLSDAHTLEDLKVTLQGGGMFAEKRVLVFEGVCTNPELCEVLLDARQMLSESDESVFVFEEKPLADVRKKLEKFAEKTERFDLPKKAEDKTIFTLANALNRRDKKALWIGYLREVAKGSPPEMIHGIFFWAAKSALLSGKASGSEKKLVADLAELPHISRRRGFDLEYALEKFVLSVS